MSGPDELAAAALRESMRREQEHPAGALPLPEQFMPPKQPEVRLAPETIDYLEERIAGAMGRVLGDALTDDNARRIFRIGLQVMREEAASHTGKLVLGGMAGLAKLVFWAAVGLTAVYTLGGWGLVKAIWAPGK